MVVVGRPRLFDRGSRPLRWFVPLPPGPQDSKATLFVLAAMVDSLRTPAIEIPVNTLLPSTFEQELLEDLSRTWVAGEPTWLMLQNC